MEKKNNVLLYVSMALVIFGVFYRIWFTIPNFSPILALSVFSSYALGRGKGLGIMLGAMIVSDIILALTQTWTDFWGYLSFQPVVYGTFALIILGAYLITKKKDAIWVAVATVGGSLFFFIVTNFFVWLDFYGWGMYPKTIDGLISCYVAAIPFYKWSILSDVLFGAGLFGVYHLAKARIEKYSKKVA